MFFRTFVSACLFPLVSLSTPCVAAYELVVSKTGFGTITAPGINCGTDCSEIYVNSQSIELTVTADSGWRIQSYSVSPPESTISAWEKQIILNELASKTGASSPPITTHSGSVAIDQSTKTISVTFAPITSFIAQTGAVLGTAVTSNALGMSTTAPISITGGQYIIDGGAPTNLPGQVSPGQSVSILMTSASTYLTATHADLNVGGVIIRFTVTTRPATYELVVTKTGSGRITATSGIDCGTDCNEIYVNSQPLELTVAADSGWMIQGYSVSPSDSALSAWEKQLILNELASKSGTGPPPITTVFGPVSIDQPTKNVNITFVPITSFTAQTGVALSTVVTSNAIGMNTTAPISITGGQYSIDGGAPTNLPGQVNPGQSISVAVTSASTYLTTTHADLIVGGVTIRFTVTTRPATYELVVTKTGSGRITATPGIDCGTDCSEIYPNSQSIQLMVAADSGWKIQSYSVSPPDSSLSAWEKQLILNELASKTGTPPPPLTTVSDSVLLDQPTKTISVTFAPITTSQGPDLVAHNINVAPASIALGSNLSVSWALRNVGTVTAGSSNTDIRILSSNSSSTCRNPLHAYVSVAAGNSIVSGGTVEQSAIVTAPTAPGTYYVCVVVDSAIGSPAQGNANTSNDFQYSAAFTVAQTYSLKGTVTDAASGLAIQGASVSVGARNVLTNAGGYYLIDHLSNSVQAITVTRAGYATNTANVNPATQPSKDLTLSRTFTACTAGTVSGVIRNSASNEPVANLLVRVGDSGEGADNSGRYSFSNVSSGTVTLSIPFATQAGFSNYSQQINVCGDTTWDIRLTSDNTVRGFQIPSGLSPDPVNTATGNYVYQRQDLKIPGKGFGFAFERTYNSQSGANGPLGFGWNHNLDASLTVDAGGVVRLRWGDGKVETYAPNGSGGFNAQYGVFDQLTSGAGGTYTLTRKNQMRYAFDAAGKLASIADRNGNVQTLSYTGGLLTQVTDTAGRNISFAYDGAGRITGITDPINRTASFAYDTAGNLASATDVRGHTTSYTYDSLHQIVKVTDPRGNAIVENTYDADRRVVTVQKDAKGGLTTYTYDPLTRKTEFTDPLGHKTTHYHDELLRLVREDDGRGASARYVFDAAGNRTAVIDKNGNLTSYEYDVRGNVTKKTDAFGNITTVAYNSRNDPVTRTDALGNVTTFTYDANGNLASTTDALNGVVTVSVNAAGQPLTITDARSNTTTNAYDGQGNLATTTDAFSNVTTFTHDGVGRRSSRKDALNRTTTVTYDAADNVLSTTDPAGKTVSSIYDANGNRASLTDKRGNSTLFTYDEKDLLVTTTDALSNVLRNAYDALDRRIAVTDRRGAVSAMRYDPVGNLVEITDALAAKTAYTYDGNGNRTSMTGPLGHVTTSAYDALNRRTQTIDPLGNATSTFYDALGRIVGTSNAKGQATSLEYDKRGRLTKVTDANGGTVLYTYDANGNRLTMTDPRGKITSYAYDALNRLLSKTEPSTGINQYQYDAVGNLTRVTRPNGTVVNYAYDSLDRLTTISYPDSTQVTLSYDDNGNRTQVVAPAGTSTFTYDALNRMTSYTGPHGESVAYSYDPNGNRTTLTYPGARTVSYVYDPLNRMTRVTDWLNRATAYTYDVAGRLVETTNPNGTQTLQGFDNADRLTSLAHRKPGQTLASYAYTLDPLGNHLQVTATEPLTPSIAAETLNYSYDNDNRLIGVGGVTYTYDANGNLTGRNADAFAYDFDDRLKQSTIAGQVSTYQYDGVGNRVARTASATTRYVLDLNAPLSQVLMETDGTNAPTAYYIYGLGLVSRVAPDGTPHYYHHDSRGSTVALTSSAGTQTDAYAYDPFGKAAGSQGTTPNPFRYVGRYGVMDEGNGIAYIRARYYEPQTGRFLTKDQKAGEEADSQSLHSYIYAANNPVRLVDVSGFSSKEIIAGMEDWAFAKQLSEFTMNWATKVRDKALMEGAKKLATPLEKVLPFVNIGVAGTASYLENRYSGNGLQVASRVTLDIGVSALAGAVAVISAPGALVAGTGLSATHATFKENAYQAVDAIGEKAGSAWYDACHGKWYCSFGLF